MPCGYCDKEMSDEWWDDLEDDEIEDAEWEVYEVKRGYYERKCYARCPHCKEELEIHDDEFNYGESLIAENYESEDEKEKCPSCLEVTFLDGDVCDDCTYCEYCEEYHPDEVTQICYENAYHKHYDGPDTDHEDYREAEDKKRKKISGVLSDPFDEVSLDSGGIKKLVVGVSIAALAYLGIKNWK